MLMHSRSVSVEDSAVQMKSAIHSLRVLLLTVYTISNGGVRWYEMADRFNMSVPTDLRTSSEDHVESGQEAKWTGVL